MQNPNELVYFNTDAEQTILGEIFFEPSNIKKVSLRPEHFYHVQNAKIFEFMRELEKQNKEIDMINLADLMLGELENIGGLSYLTQLASIGFGKNVIPLEKIIMKLFISRETFKLNQRMSKEITEGVDPILAMGRFQQDFETLQKNNSIEDDDDGHISKVLQKLAVSSETDKGEVVGGKTHFKDLDKMLNGIKPKSFNIIAARPSVGKTALAMNICQNYCLDKEKPGVAVIFSIEMPEEDLGERMISSFVNIDGQKVKNPAREFDENEWLKFYQSLGEMSHMKMYIHDKSEVDIEFVRRKTRMIAEKHPGEQIYILIDYIQLMKGDPRFEGNRNLQLTVLSEQLKSLAKELGASVLALSQLSRNVEQRNDKRPMLSDLRDSGGLEAAADTIWMLYRDDYYNKESEDKGLIEIIIGKNRGGAVGTVQLAFRKELSKFINIG